MNANVRIWIMWLLVLAVPAVGQVRGFVWEDGRLKQVGEPIQYTEPYEGEWEAPMAENLWTNGASDGRWDTAGNWSLGHEPADDEDVILSAQYPTSITTGFRGVGEDIELRSFHRHPDYTGDVGTSGDPLVASTKTPLNPINPYDNQGKVIVQGPGKFYYKNAPGGVANTTANIYIDTNELAETIEIDGAFNKINLVQGRVKFLSGVTASFCSVSFKSNPTSDVHLTSEQTGSIGRLLTNGGTIVHTGSGAYTIIYINGGRMTISAAAQGAATLWQGAGMLIDKSGTTLVAGAVMGGTLDLSQDPRAKQIDALLVFPNGTVLLNPNTAIGTGGSVSPIVGIHP